MGQAWCKEKSTKAQDSKSPLDRVFLRCAHRIYPGLKEEGSVLGGATQRVTSSEIGYASSPPREVLTRGQSIDSVDRPFHPNDWVDVNLEVPGTPRAGSVMTNLTLDTTLYPPTTLTSTNSSGSNLRDFTPVPPPRRRKKNRGRPLPPKPDELVSRSHHVDRVTTRNSSNKETSRSSSHEPLYSSVKSHKTKSGEKEVFEHKVNGTGRVIPNIVLAANRSNREKSTRVADDRKISRPKNSSTVSLPNFSELEASNDVSLGEDDGVLKVHKITAAESLPSLIGGGSAKNAEGVEREDKIVEADRGKIDKVDKTEQEPSVDEVDFSFDTTKSEDALDYVAKLGILPRLTSTPVKNGFGDDARTPTTGGGWFLHQDRSPKSNEPEDTSTNDSTGKRESSESQFHDCTKTSRSDVFLESEEDQLEESKDSAERAVEAETEKPRTRTTRPSLKRTLSNESEPFDSYEEKELRGETESRALRSNSQIKLLDRSISEESLPREMLDQPEDTDFFDDDNDKRRSTATIVGATSDANEKKKEEPSIAESVKTDTKTPPPSPEPKIKPEIFDNDHSTLLKVLRDEAEESNLSSMTPSLTELEAALSDMLEREVDQEKPEAEETVRNVTTAATENTEVVEKSLEKPIEPRIDVEKNIKKSALPVSLKNILGDMEKSSRYPEKVEENIKDDSMVEIDLTNGETFIPAAQHELVEIALNNSSRATTTMTSATLEPPEKPSRLHQISANESSENSGKQPTPPRRRNRSSASGHSTTVLRENVRRSSERTATPDNPYPNDRLI